MFRPLNTLAIGIAVTASSVLPAGEIDLFSSVRTTSVYGDSQSTPVAAPTPRRITDSDRLSLLLSQSGFDTSTAGRRVVSTKKPMDDRTFPVLVVISKDEKNLGIVLALSVVKDENSISAGRLLKLMEANQKHAPAQFAYSSARKRMELFVRIRNENLTGQRLRDEINRLAILAGDTRDLWGMESESDAAPATKTEPAPNSVVKTDQTAPQTAFDLTGRWSATRSTTEAFAVQFSATGTFNLVYVKNGNQSKSTGRFILTGETLTLNGSDGIRLEGAFTSQSATSFQFQPKNLAALRFTKAR